MKFALKHLIQTLIEIRSVVLETNTGVDLSLFAHFMNLVQRIR